MNQKNEETTNVSCVLFVEIIKVWHSDMIAKVRVFAWSGNCLLFQQKALIRKKHLLLFPKTNHPINILPTY